MKQGWEIKKLGEVATYINGFAFKPEQWTDNGIPIIRIQNLNNPSAPYNYCDFEVPSKYLVEQGDILISWSASLGVYEWNNDNGYLNQHIFKVVFDKGNINKYYFKYAVASKLNIMLENLHGATMKHIVKKDFDNTLIPVPPLPEQEKIVSELDCLSGIIEKKRQQLKELDALAQSIFYEMFGNPVENERGWEVKKLSDMCENLDYQRRPITAKDRISGYIPYYGASGVVDYVRDYIFDGDFLLISEDGANLQVRHTPIAFSITGKTWVNNHAHILRFENFCTQRFMEFYINLSDISDIVRGCAQPKLTQASLNNILVFDIPLPLQQSFAQKIEAIEQQKALIKQSIAEVETLFNARMQEYFE